MEPQAIYDKVKAHLLKQGEKAVDSDGACLYLNEAGLMCAAGCLLEPDSPAQQSEAAWPKRSDGIRYASGDTDLQSQADQIGHYLLVFDLQGVHDDYHPHKWEEQLRIVAEKFGLNP